MFTSLSAWSKNKYLIFNKVVCVGLSNKTADVAALRYIKPIISK